MQVFCDCKSKLDRTHNNRDVIALLTARNDVFSRYMIRIMTQVFLNLVIINVNEWIVTDTNKK